MIKKTAGETGDLMVPARMPNGWDVVCVGETMALLVPVDASPLHAGSLLTLEVGGAESNVACGLAALGHRVTWLSRLGSDPFGDRLRDTLAGYGVDLSGVEVDSVRRTGVYFKNPGAGGTTVYYYRAGSAASVMGPELAKSPALHQTRLIHLTGITPALSPSCAALIEELAARRSGSALVSFDVNYRPALWDTSEAAPVLSRLAQGADVVFVGLDEARLLWGVRTPAQVRELLPRPDVLVVKDADRGATAFDRAGATFVPALAVRVIEPVGAGDAFAAGYLSALLNGRDQTARLRTGHLLAAAALAVAGDLGPRPNRAVLDAMLALSDVGWAQLEISSADR
jgi:2-dehydro-3-deoxygluconokinase